MPFRPNMTDAPEQVEAPSPAPAVAVAPAPHLAAPVATRGMMIDVIIALAPVMLAAVLVFGWYAPMQVGICVGTCVVVELALTACRGRRVTVTDGSAVVTGCILAFSLPPTGTWYVGVIGSAVAIGIGKWVFGGLGQNLFNPAMVGRAFVMLAFAAAVGAGGYVARPEAAWVQVVTQATPMAAAKAGQAVTPLWKLLLGNTNGSLGETSAVACLLGGAWLLLRRTISWHVPAGVLGTAAAIAALMQALGRPALGVPQQLCGGALLFGALFIATDLVTSPLTAKGKLIFGVCVGALVMLIRTMSNYPEGVMFAVLVMNAFVPLINRWTIPVPLGGAVKKK